MVVAVCLILALTPGCQISAAQIYIPLGYGLTGLCVALLMSPTAAAGCGRIHRRWSAGGRSL